jgi:hypothetical protein
MGAKRLVAGLVLVAAIAVAALWWLAGRWVDDNLDRFQVAAAEALGRPVRIGGASVRILGRPGIRISDVVIGDDPAFGDSPFLTADRVAVTVRLLALLEGRLEVASVDLERPSIRLVRAADGRMNTATLGRRAAGAPPAADTEGGGGNGGGRNLAWLIALVDMEDGRLTFVDHRQTPPRTIAAEAIDLEISDLAPDRAVRVALSAAVDSASVNVRLSGEVGPLGGDGAAPFSLRGRLGPVPQNLPIAVEVVELGGSARAESVEVDSLRLGACGGEVAGRAVLPLADGAPLAAVLQARGLDVGQVLAAFAPELRTAVEGVASAAIDLQGAGGDEARLRQSLRGTVTATIADGVLRNFNLPGEVARRVTQLPGLTRLLSRGLEPKYAAVIERPDTRFESMDLRLRLVAGGLDVESVRLEGEDYGATAAGSIGDGMRADLRGQVALSRRFSDDIVEDVKEARLLFDADGRISFPFVYRGILGEARPTADLDALATTILRGRSKDLADVLRESGHGGSGAVDSIRRKLSEWFSR